MDVPALKVTALIGPSGCGKTTLAQIIAEKTLAHFESVSAVLGGVKDLKEAVERARRVKEEQRRKTILFVDEIHRFNKSQQDALLPSVETGLLVLVGATTENPYFEVNAPLMSRSTLFRLQPLGPSALAELARRGLDAEGATADDDAVAHLVDRCGGDGRHLLTSLEVALALAAQRAGTGQVRVDLVDAEGALGASPVRYGQDDHYDVVSAFIKSIRGSDPDAALHWLARMLEAGEDARFIVRRLLVSASEDVGMADPLALVVVEAAARAVDHVGLPEARINLAQATVHLALAPKSSSAYAGLDRAIADVRSRPVGEVPAHLRDAHYSGARHLGHGKGYQYPHDAPAGWVPQQYLPDELLGRTYYEPTPHGAEGRLVARWRERRGEAPPAQGGAEVADPAPENGKTAGDADR